MATKGWDTMFRTLSKVGLGTLVAAVIVVAGLALTVHSAWADAPRVSQGDAEAVYNAIGGRGAITVHSTLQGARDTQLVRITPFGIIGRHYCSLDWHVVGINLGDFGPREVAAAALNPFVVTNFIDGTMLAFSSAALKPDDRQHALVTFGSSDVWFRAYATVVPPEALSLGAHTVEVLAVNPVTRETVDTTNTFFIDAPGTGACL
jgi:hypothetical protein